MMTNNIQKGKLQLCSYLSSLPVALLSSVACELVCFFSIFTSLFIRVTSAMIMYDKRTLLDIGQRYTNLIQDTLYTDPAWPLEILRSTAADKGRLNNTRRRKKAPRETCWNPQQTEEKGSQSPSTEYFARQCSILG